MKTVANKTQRPLSVPLPRGKTLRLGPGGIGQITTGAAEYPPVKKLVESGAIEITDEPPTRPGGFGGGRGAGAGVMGRASGGGGRRTGDR